MSLEAFKKGATIIAIQQQPIIHRAFSPPQQPSAPISHKPRHPHNEPSQILGEDELPHGCSGTPEHHIFALLLGQVTPVPTAVKVRYVWPCPHKFWGFARCLHNTGIITSVGLCNYPTYITTLSPCWVGSTQTTVENPSS